jgi:hypothetical protein
MYKVKSIQDPSIVTNTRDSNLNSSTHSSTGGSIPLEVGNKPVAYTQEEEEEEDIFRFFKNNK